MKIKVGQWVRFGDNIMKVVEIEDKEGTIWINVNGGIFSAFGYDMYKNDIKVADTPQELIQVGDLVETVWTTIAVIPVYEVEKGKIIDSPFSAIDNEDITKILTPNSKGDYIKQWETK